MRLSPRDSNATTHNGGNDQTADTAESTPTKQSSESKETSKSASGADISNPDSTANKPAVTPPINSDVSDQPWFDGKSLPWSYAEAHYVGATRIGFAILRVETTQVNKQLRIIREDIIDHAADGSSIPPRRIVLELFEQNNGLLMTTFKFESSTDGKTELLIEGRRQGSDLIVTKKSADLEVENSEKIESSKIPWNLKFWGPLGVQQILMRQPLKAGEKRASSIFVPQLNQFVPVRLDANQPELTPLADGKTASLMQINLTVGSKDSASHSSLFVDDQGVIQKTISRNGDQILLKLRIDENVATRLADQTQFSRWSAKKLKLLGDSAALDASSNITYLVEAELDESDPYNALLAYKRQRLKSRSATSCEVQVSKNFKQGNGGLGEAKIAASDADREPSDAEKNSTVMIPSDKQPIIDLANEIVGDVANNQRSPQELAEQLRAGIHHKIKLRSEISDINSTLVAARERSANCIEAAHLFAAVLRNQNIPSRIASGLRFDPKLQSFGFHVWNQAWIDGKWFDLDATNPSIVTSAYITMGVNSGEGENPFAYYLDSLSKINKLNSIRLLSAEN
ncbi:MAG: transglutaminase domain-containing protein [Pirellulales bacterium]